MGLVEKKGAAVDDRAQQSDGAGPGLPAPALEDAGNGFLPDITEFRADLDRSEITGPVQAASVSSWMRAEMLLGR